MTDFQAPEAVRSRRAYIAEAMLEYLINLLVVDTFLASLLRQCGIPDDVTGILSSIIALACGVQMFSSLLIRPGRSVRRVMLVLGVANQLLFSSLYLIPFLAVEQEYRTWIFAAVLVTAYFLLNLGTPAKYRWMNSFVSPKKRGIFTAKKEMGSLLGGIVYTLVMGMLADRFRDSGREKTGFLVFFFVLLGVTVLHTASMLMVKDEDGASAPEASRHPVKEIFSMLAGSKALRRLLVLNILWQAAWFLSIPFYGTWLIGDLGFSMTAVSLINILHCLCRLFISPMTGRFGDRRGWWRMLVISSLTAAAAYLCNVFAMPGTRWLYIGQQVLFGLALAGMSGGLNNTTYDYIDMRHFTIAFGARNAISGTLGFFVSLAGSAVVRGVQAAGNRIGGRTVYAQQLLSAGSCLLMLCMALYVWLVIRKMPKLKEKKEARQEGLS